MVLAWHCSHAVDTEGYVVVALCTYCRAMVLDCVQSAMQLNFFAYIAGLWYWISVVGMQCVQSTMQLNFFVYIAGLSYWINIAGKQ